MTINKTSDKGKKMTISTIECYERQGRKEIKDDKKVDEKEKKKDVRELDELGRQLAEIFKVGEERGPGNSAKAYSNLGNKSGDILIKDTMPKTHKDKDEDGDPKARGLVRAAATQNARVNNFVAEIIDGVRKIG